MRQPSDLNCKIANGISQLLEMWADMQKTGRSAHAAIASSREL